MPESAAGEFDLRTLNDEELAEFEPQLFGT